MSEVAVVVMYNHAYPENIPVVEKLYAGRFSQLYHLVPFYQGDQENVIPVYGSSYYFQGFITQALDRFKTEGVKHYLFVADDLILNPAIDENNYHDFFQVRDQDAYIGSFIEFHHTRSYWQRTAEALAWSIKQPGVEAEGLIPDAAEAQLRFASHGLEMGPISFRDGFKNPSEKPLLQCLRSPVQFIRWLRYSVKHLKKQEYTLAYPLVGGYSDIFIVDADSLSLFSHYCGVFAATNLFVEIAIPTALALSCRSIRTEAQTAFPGKALWTQEELKILEPYAFDLSRLLRFFPNNCLFLHPVKLSRWQFAP
jgi:hypothetical protein